MSFYTAQFVVPDDTQISMTSLIINLLPIHKDSIWGSLFGIFSRISVHEWRIKQMKGLSYQM